MECLDIVIQRILSEARQAIKYERWQLIGSYFSSVRNNMPDLGEEPKEDANIICERAEKELKCWLIENGENIYNKKGHQLQRGVPLYDRNGNYKFTFLNFSYDMVGYEQFRLMDVNLFHLNEDNDSISIKYLLDFEKLYYKPLAK